MGLFDWLSKKRLPSPPAPAMSVKQPALAATAAKPAAAIPVTGPAGEISAAQCIQDYPELMVQPKPDKIFPMGENSPMIGFVRDGALVVMDRDAYDYTYGDRTLPDPAQHDLDEVLAGVTLVCILEGGLYRGNAMSSRVFAWVNDADEIGLLRDALKIVKEPATLGHCHCLGGPTLECYAGPTLVATIGLQHGKAIRWNRWHHDAVLDDGSKITQWLLRQGISDHTLHAVNTRGNNHLLSEPPDKPYWTALAEAAQSATKLKQEGKLAEVLPQIDQLIRDYPQKSEPYSLRAEVNESLDNYAAMPSDLETAFELGLRNDSLLLLRARVKMAQGMHDVAVAACSHALQYAPDRPDIYNLRANCYANLGKTSEALADWQRAIELKPDWMMPYMLRSQLHHQLANLDQARHDVDKAIELVNAIQPPQPGTMSAMAELLFLRGDIRYDCFQHKEAEGDLEVVCRLDPGMTGRVGDLWLRRGQSDRALAAFTRSIELFPDDYRGYAARATLYMSKAKWDKALPDSDVLVRLAPDRNSHGLRGIVLLQLNRLEDALRDLTIQLEKTPDDLRSLLSRAALYAKLGRFEDSRQDRERASQLAPENPAVMNMLAWILATAPMHSLRDGPRAVELAQKACELTQWKDSNNIDTLAAACAEVGRFEDAVKYQTQAVDMPIDAPEDFLQRRRDRVTLYQSGQPFREEATR